MSTTTVVGTGLHSSVLLPNWKPKMSSSTTSQNLHSPLDKFPLFDDAVASPATDQNTLSNHQPLRYSQPTRWQPRKQASLSPIGPKQRPRKSISEAIGGFRDRGTSVSVNAQELAEALKAPVSYKLIGLCVIWYTTSALTNTSSKSILTTLSKPITLTIVQFAFVSIWCSVLATLASLFPSLRRAIPALKNGLRRPSVDVIRTTLPLAVFQVLGHILSSMATSQIPVSMVHTIKGLSPLFTVLAYRTIFGIKYARATYLSLVPLTTGVMLACSSGFSTNFFGILCAFCAALVFVSQNIFSKKLFNESNRAEAEGHAAGPRKLDKLNLLYYCSGQAFLLTLPVWFVSEGYNLTKDFLHDFSINLSTKSGTLDHGPLMLEFVFNGVSHFAQNILAFIILSMISPVSYSVASLIKRVFVIVVAIVWFGSSTTSVQAFGIGLTFLGLYLYDRTSHDDAADRRANADRFYHTNKNPLLPLNTKSNGAANGFSGPSSSGPWDSNGYVFPSVPKPQGEYAKPPTRHHSSKKEKEDVSPNRHGHARKASAVWLPPGTKQESTWQEGDSQVTAPKN
ncbi:solute carrier family 35, member E1 [Blastomyces parvus]|uniref:Solute carrier family 35, member E1 n=1 Tax=Blastomyces parvus TaxID=2060905 RepID=A0A2B7WVN2_9EURO|nr:solute carrier family 35, member E1 [Blastomyces parvus]